MTSSETVRLRRNAQHRVGGLTAGIMAMSPDPADPAARVALADAAGRTARPVLRPGRPVHVLDTVVEALEVDTTEPGSVLLKVGSDE